MRNCALGFVAIATPRNDDEKLRNDACIRFNLSSSASIQLNPSIWRKPRRTAQYLPSPSSNVFCAKL